MAVLIGKDANRGNLKENFDLSWYFYKCVLGGNQFFNTRFTDEGILTVYNKNVSEILPFFLYKISECNKVYLSIRRANSLPSIKNSLLKRDRPTPNSHFNIYNPIISKLISGFRFRLSNLNEQKFDHNLSDGISVLAV